MHARIKRKFCWLAVLVGAAGVLYLASVVSWLWIPVGWRHPGEMFSGGSQRGAYVSYDNLALPRVNFGVSFRRNEGPVHLWTRVSVGIEECDSRGDPLSKQELHAEVVAWCRKEFLRECMAPFGFPEAVNQFDAALAAPGGEVLIEYPERRGAAALATGAGVARVASFVLLGFAVLLLLWLIPAWVSVRRLARFGCCLHCGYDLKGIAGEVCPECGRA